MQGITQRSVDRDQRTHVHGAPPHRFCISWLVAMYGSMSEHGANGGRKGEGGGEGGAGGAQGPR